MDEVDPLTPAEIDAATEIVRRLDKYRASPPMMARAALNAAAKARAAAQARRDGYNRDPRLVAVLRRLAASLDVKLECPCGRAPIDADGICPECERDLPGVEAHARWQQERDEAERRHGMALKVGCPYCGAAEGAECVTQPGRAPLGVRDHKDRYRAACSLLETGLEGETDGT